MLSLLASRLLGSCRKHEEVLGHYMDDAVLPASIPLLGRRDRGVAELVGDRRRVAQIGEVRLGHHHREKFDPAEEGVHSTMKAPERYVIRARDPLLRLGQECVDQATRLPVPDLADRRRKLVLEIPVLIEGVAEDRRLTLSGCSRFLDQSSPPI
jgi:hypothetical protein